MKRLVLIYSLIGLLASSCACSLLPSTSTTIYPTSTTSSYVPSTSDDPFPEYVPPQIDTSGFTLDNIPVNFTAINDFHGQIDEEKDDNRVGLAKMSTYLKGRKAAGDILISSGDMYQGSYISGVDHGQFISYAHKNIGFDAYVIGNHEFDWGIEKLLDNQKAIGQNFIGSNIYEYPYSQISPKKSNFGDEYKIINLYKGTPFEVKVGIIGVIGKEQISSITSTYVSDYVFIDPTEVVKNISVYLKEQQKCDFVIASYHDGEPNESIAEKAYGKTYTYVDACFMAHTHKYDYKKVNNVPFIQASAYSRGVSTVRFSFNKNKKTFTLNESKYEYLAAMNLAPDPIMNEKINDKKTQYEKEYVEIIGKNNTGGEINVGKMSQFYAKLTYDRAKEQYKNEFNIIGCMFNESRRSLKGGDFTYSDIYETHPFLNDIYILSVSSEDILNEKNFAYGFIDSNTKITKLSGYHDILAFDYNGFHIGINNAYVKYYNFFPTAFSASAKHKPYKIDFNCLEVAIDFLKENHSIENSFFSEEGFFGKMN